jgi:hypothetical protein
VTPRSNGNRAIDVRVDGAGITNFKSSELERACHEPRSIRIADVALTEVGPLWATRGRRLPPSAIKGFTSNGSPGTTDPPYRSLTETLDATSVRASFPRLDNSPIPPPSVDYGDPPMPIERGVPAVAMR